MSKTTTTTVKAHLRDIRSASHDMNRQPTNAPSNIIPVMKPLPNSVAVWGNALWNSSMTLMIEITPMS
jgi:hypothetical protein